jgi:hypothetical protein
MPQLQQRINRTRYFKSISDSSFGAVVTNNKDSQRQGPDLHLPSEVRVSSHHVPPRTVGTRRTAGLKGQKNGTVVGNFDPGQAEEDSDRLLLVVDEENNLKVT